MDRLEEQLPAVDEDAGQGDHSRFTHRIGAKEKSTNIWETNFVHERRRRHHDTGERRDGSWVLNGRKKWIGKADWADFLIAVAVTDRRRVSAAA